MSAVVDISVLMVNIFILFSCPLFDSDIVSEFSDIDQTNPDCVVMGDATDEFTYKNMNKAFHVLLESEKPHLITLGAGYALL